MVIKQNIFSTNFIALFTQKVSPITKINHCPLTTALAAVAMLLLVFVAMAMLVSMAMLMTVTMLVTVTVLVAVTMFVAVLVAMAMLVAALVTVAALAATTTAVATTATTAGRRLAFRRGDHDSHEHRGEQGLQQQRVSIIITRDSLTLVGPFIALLLSLSKIESLKMFPYQKLSRRISLSWGFSLGDLFILGLKAPNAL